jgi:hypothetical protein
MLPNRKGQGIFTGIARALDNLPLEIDQPVILKYDDKDIIGYYAGFVTDYSTKIGLKKIEGSLHWKWDLYEANEIWILTDNIKRQHLKSLPLEEQLNRLEINEPVEIVFSQQYNIEFNKQFKQKQEVIAGIIGYWNGKTKSRIKFLNFHYDKLKNIYYDMNDDGDVSQIPKDNIIPKISKIIEVNPLTYLNIN